MLKRLAWDAEVAAVLSESFGIFTLKRIIRVFSLYSDRKAQVVVTYAFYGFFTEWIAEINPKDYGDARSGVPGR